MASLHRFPRFHLFRTGTGEATVRATGGGLGFVEFLFHIHVDCFLVFVYVIYR